MVKNQPASASMIFEKMAMADLDQVMAIERKAFSSPWTQSMFLSELWDNPFSYSYVARDEERREVVGYVCFWIVVDELHLMNIAVRPDWRRKGIGEELALLALHVGEARGARSATLEVRASNLSAQALYRKLGFRETGVRKNYYQDPKENALLFQCDLSPHSEEGAEAEEPV